MCETPGKMHMHDMVKIDTIVFEIVGGGGGEGWPASLKDKIFTIQISSNLTISISTVWS